MFKALKQYFSTEKRISKRAKEISGKQDIEYHIRLEKGEEFSRFSTDENKIIEPELIEHIDHEISTISKKNNLNIIVHSPKENKIDAEELESELDEHYKKEIIKTHLESKSLIRSGILMLFVGALIFGIYVLLKTYVGNSLWFELIDIASWVFVWEAVDCIFLSQLTMKEKKAKYIKVVNAKIQVIEE